jgi:predicted kinase
MVGMICSGKSTYARKRAEEGWLVCSHDSLLQMLYQNYTYNKELRFFYERLEESIAEAILREGMNVVIDRTHLGLESRQRWIKFAKNFLSVKVRAVVFPREDPVAHALRRYKSEARGVSFQTWLKAAYRHEQQALDNPIDWKAEGFDDCVMLPQKETQRGRV